MHVTVALPCTNCCLLSMVPTPETLGCTFNCLHTPNMCLCVGASAIDFGISSAIVPQWPEDNDPPVGTGVWVARLPSTHREAP
jgi:hypothetical protein